MTSNKPNHGTTAPRAWHHPLSVRIASILTGGLLALVIALLPQPAAATPTVDGVVFGDDSAQGGDGTPDIDEYILYDTSALGSKLYIFLDIPTNKLYVALVVGRDVNDNVFGAKGGTANKPYANTADWNSIRSADNLVNSEFAEFTFECAQGDANNSYSWQQGYACEVDGNGDPMAGTGVWDSDAQSACAGGLGQATDVPGATLGDTTPLSLDSASSFMYNMNRHNYNDHLAGTDLYPWELFIDGGVTVKNFHSPFDKDHPLGRDTVDFDGSYPASPSTDQPGFSDQMDYEWSMIYEWSVDLGPGGANCGENNIFVVTGLSHHSPSKLERDVENDPFDPPTEPLSDFGDLPDTYATKFASDGARHFYVPGSPLLGSDPDTAVDIEADAPEVLGTDADGDDTTTSNDEDGVEVIVNDNWEEGTTQQFEVTVTGPGVLGFWFDWNGDGDFDDAGEYDSETFASAGTFTVDVAIPDNADDSQDFQWETDVLNSRFRLFSSTASAPGGSLDSLDFNGAAADGEVEDYTFSVGSLPVTLNSFEADKRGHSIRFEWGTASETATVGFNFWGRIGDDWQQLNEVIYLNQATDSVSPRRYETTIRPAHANLPGAIDIQAIEAFGISSMDTDGSEHFFGPFEAGRAYGTNVTPEPIPWGEIQAELDQKLAEQGYVKQGNRWRRDVRGPRGKGAGKGGKTGTPGLQDIVYMETEVPGIQRVTYEQLLGSGVDLAGVPGDQLAITHKGQAVARYLEANRGLGFGPGSYIEFIAAPVDKEDRRYTHTNVYRLQLDPDLVVDSASVNSAGNGAVPDYYMASAERDVNLSYGLNMPAEEPWYEHRLIGVPGWLTGSASVDLQLDNLVKTANDPRVKVRLGLSGITFFADGEDDHNVRVFLNDPNEPLADLVNDGVVDWRIELPVSTEQLLEGNNRVTIEVPGVSGHLFDLIYGDTYRIDYPRAFVARNDTLTFTEQAGAFELDGFTSNDVVAYASTGDDLYKLRARTGDAALGGQVRIPGLPNDKASYWVSTTGAVNRPAVLNVGPVVDLASEAADYVIITHASFLDALESSDFLSAKRSQGFTTKVVEIGRIFDQFGHGLPVPASIREYLRAQEETAEIEHVLLVGGATSDPLNYGGSGSIDFIPTFFTKTGPIIQHTPADGLIVDLYGPAGQGSEADGVPDKSIGRWPVRTVAELNTIIDKTLTYQDEMADDGTVLLVADKDSSEVPSYAKQTQRIGAILSESANGAAWSDFVEVFHDDFDSVGKAREALIQGINDGKTTTIYSGHGSTSGWTRDGLLDYQTARALENHGRPTLVSTITCYTSYFVSPSTNTIGHQLLLNGDNGAALIHGAATLSGFAQNEAILSRVTASMARGESTGKAVLEARQTLGSGFGPVIRNWSLLGDPALGFAPPAAQ